VYIFPAQQIEVSGFLADSDSRSPYPEARSEIGRFWRCGPHRAKFLAESVWEMKTQLEKTGSGLLIQVGLLGRVIEDLLRQFQQPEEETSVTAIWMTEEEGVEEKREERDVRKAAEKFGVDFRLWLDEKYFIDEYASCGDLRIERLTSLQPRRTLRQTDRSPRCFHKLPKISGTAEGCTTEDCANTIIIAADAISSSVKDTSVLDT
jgi:hypothetical protein